MKVFFPSLAFAWAFVFLLLIPLALAAWIDFKTTRIPKAITLPLAGLGLIINAIRGALMGSDNQDAWLFGAGSPGLGALDGFLFGLTGLLVAFAIFTFIYVLGSCRGGDVKLCAAIGAWIGPLSILFLLLVSVVVLLGWSLGNLMVYGPPSRKETKRAKDAARKGVRHPGGVTFSAVALISTALVMGWVYRYELHLDDPPKPPTKEACHAMVASATN